MILYTFLYLYSISLHTISSLFGYYLYLHIEQKRTENTKEYCCCIRVVLFNTLRGPTTSYSGEISLLKSLFTRVYENYNIDYSPVENTTFLNIIIYAHAREKIYTYR